ncbi:MAG: hypothetical protein EP298_03995 [Gammaproteobacteria bacterium]|nr:MAG: hypothetical protein EP298_03995 [Gammaproteobacteria bacterium]UTW43791.1 hypothetical protein KFE69_06800 [bacterium SCSIO 12844]
MIVNNIKNNFHDMVMFFDYFNIDNSIAYNYAIDKNNPFEKIIMEQLGINEEKILKKYQHIQALDDFLYHWNLNNMEIM